MARQSFVVTISLPPKMALWTAEVAKKKAMTRSELLRSALRRYLEETDIIEDLLAAGSKKYRKQISVARRAKKLYTSAQVKKRLGLA